jgi:hypothetical protein
LTAGHRARLFSRHLPEFGYRPIILTVRPKDYEQLPDNDLLNLVDPAVQVVRTRAIPTRPVRWVGDLGVRSLPFHAAAIRRLIRGGGIDLVFFSIFPAYSSLLGPWVRGVYGVPYVIDYQDPWVYTPAEGSLRSWKARASHLLARILEPAALIGVSGIMGVAEGYYSGVLKRHPRLRALPNAGIPLGGESLDHEYVRQTHTRSALLERPRLAGKIVLTYAGAPLPKAYGTLRTLLKTCKRWIESGDPAAANVMLLFVGTGVQANDPSSGVILPIARECGAEAFVEEVAKRQPYVDVLRLLHQSHGVMILGSSEASYTPSKTFQALASKRPVLALLHAGSSASEVLRDMPGVSLVNFDDTRTVEHCAAEIEAGVRTVAMASITPVERSLERLDEFSARSMTRRLAWFFDSVLDGFGNR